MKTAIAETLGPLQDMTVTEAVEYLEAYGLKIPLGGVGLETVKQMAQIIQARDRQLGLSSLPKVMVIKSDDISEDQLHHLRKQFQEKLGAAAPAVILVVSTDDDIKTLSPVDTYRLAVEALTALKPEDRQRALEQAQQG